MKNIIDFIKLHLWNFELQLEIYMYIECLSQHQKNPPLSPNLLVDDWPGDFNILFVFFVIMPYNPIQYLCFSLPWIAYF